MISGGFLLAVPFRLLRQIQIYTGASRSIFWFVPPDHGSIVVRTALICDCSCEVCTVVRELGVRIIETTGNIVDDCVWPRRECRRLTCTTPLEPSISAITEKCDPLLRCYLLESCQTALIGDFRPAKVRVDSCVVSHSPLLHRRTDTCVIEPSCLSRRQSAETALGSFGLNERDFSVSHKLRSQRG